MRNKNFLVSFKGRFWYTTKTQDPILGSQGQAHENCFYVAVRQKSMIHARGGMAAQGYT